MPILYIYSYKSKKKAIGFLLVEILNIKEISIKVVLLKSR